VLLRQLGYALLNCSLIWDGSVFQLNAGVSKVVADPHGFVQIHDQSRYTKWVEFAIVGHPF